MSFCRVIGELHPMPTFAMSHQRGAAEDRAQQLFERSRPGRQIDIEIALSSVLHLRQTKLLRAIAAVSSEKLSSSGSDGAFGKHCGTIHP